MARTGYRWSARLAGVVAGAVLIAGGTAGVTYAADATGTDVRAETTWLPTVEINNTFAVVATPHPDTVGCDGFQVTGSGSSLGKPLGNGGTWSQTETACKATIPGKWDIKGTGTITEPNGEKLTISYSLTAPVTTDTMVYPTGTFTITGSTGNWAFARGGGKMSARVNMLDHSRVTSMLVGDIEYLG
ncbi:hypothetical protein [Streptomyces roseicoloratus]|uniref:hypothetical protein n=1 Tax=Streptomyces roseicoloratus TaxID=2508722 RepID=UPI001009E94D|nr:hypothetical protein [Streptomyces roseicoloratus]